MWNGDATPKEKTFRKQSLLGTMIMTIMIIFMALPATIIIAVDIITTTIINNAINIIVTTNTVVVTIIFCVIAVTARRFGGGPRTPAPRARRRPGGRQSRSAHSFRRNAGVLGSRCHPEV